MILYLYLSNSRIYQLHRTDLLATCQLDLTLTSLSTLVHSCTAKQAPWPSNFPQVQNSHNNFTPNNIHLSSKGLFMFVPQLLIFSVLHVLSFEKHGTSIHLHCFALRCTSPCPQYLFPLCFVKMHQRWGCKTTFWESAAIVNCSRPISSPLTTNMSSSEVSVRFLENTNFKNIVMSCCQISRAFKGSHNFAKHLNVSGNPLTQNKIKVPLCILMGFIFGSTI